MRLVGPLQNPRAKKQTLPGSAKSHKPPEPRPQSGRWRALGCSGSELRVRGGRRRRLLTVGRAGARSDGISGDRSLSPDARAMIDDLMAAITREAPSR